MNTYECKIGQKYFLLAFNPGNWTLWDCSVVGNDGVDIKSPFLQVRNVESYKLYSTQGFSFSMCLKFALDAVVEQSFNEEEVQPASNLFTEKRRQGNLHDW